MNEINPYEPPSAPIEAPAPEEAPSLWNPDVAGLWSLLLTPVFGSFIVLKNWQAIGDPDRIRTARTWLGISLFMLVFYFLIPYSPLVYIIVWYFSFQRKQTQYVHEQWGKQYPKRSWWVPLAIGIPAVLAFFWLAGLVIQWLTIALMENILPGALQGGG